MSRDYFIEKMPNILGMSDSESEILFRGLDEENTTKRNLYHNTSLPEKVNRDHL